MLIGFRLAAFGIAFFTSMGGVSGAFLLLPFQMSVLGYTSPSVSATNQLFNIVAIPSGVWRYCKEGRMVWPRTYFDHPEKNIRMIEIIDDMIWIIPATSQIGYAKKKSEFSPLQTTRPAIRATSHETRYCPSCSN